MIKQALYDMFRWVILANELDDNPAFITRFSDPDGVRSGKSGWSYGLCQFDTQNNPLALKCLKDCGFSPEEIEGIVKQTIDVKPLEKRLQENKEIIDRYDDIQLSGCVSRAANVMAKHNIMVADDACILAIADYDNQYSLSDNLSPGHLLGYLAGLGRACTAEDVLDYKLKHTKYGNEHPRDCHRRYENLIKITSGRS